VKDRPRRPTDGPVGAGRHLWGCRANRTPLLGSAKAAASAGEDLRTSKPDRSHRRFRRDHVNLDAGIDPILLRL